MLLPPALSEGLAGFWSFDEALALDVSGQGSHGVSSVTPGPAFAGQGSSAFFRRSFMLIDGAEKLALRDFSYTFWLYIVEHAEHHSGPQFCPLLRKGLDGATEAGSSPSASSPAILFDRGSRRLRVEMATAVDGGPKEVEGFESNARLSTGRWYHVAVARLDGQRRTRLYVNGILDTSESTKGFTLANEEPLYVGSDPVALHQCDMPVYIDELKVHNRPLIPDEIQAEAATSLAGIEPAFVRLACIDCPLQTAMENCPDKYHICNSLELHMGGYQVARTLGWLDKKSHVWSHAPVSNTALQSGGGLGPTSALQTAHKKMHIVSLGPGMEAPSKSEGLGLGICCADSE